MGNSTYCHMCNEYWEDCDCAARNKESGFEDGVRHVLSRVAVEASCEDCGEDIWVLVPASRLPKTPGIFKTKPLHLTWHVYDVSGNRHSCEQRRQRKAEEAGL